MFSDFQLSDLSYTLPNPHPNPSPLLLHTGVPGVFSDFQLSELSYTLSYTLPNPHHPNPSPLLLPLGVPGVFSDFQLSDLARSVADRQTAAKQSVPHYYLSVELNLTKLMLLREELNQGQGGGGGGKGGIGGDVSVLDMLVKASALAMKQVVNQSVGCLYTFLLTYSITHVLTRPRILFHPTLPLALPCRTLPYLTLSSPFSLPPPLSMCLT